MKELNRNIFGKGLFAAIKGHLCLRKGHLDNPEGLVELEHPSRNMFLTRFIQIGIFFFKKGFFNEASDPWTLYLSKIGPGKEGEVYPIRSIIYCFI